MRRALLLAPLASFTCWVAPAAAQTLAIDQRLAPRYGISAAPEFYPQGTAKEALASAAKALEGRRYEYVVAHLLDPATADAKVAEQARLVEPTVEAEFRALRAEQARLPGKYPNDQLLPLTPDDFADRVKAEATARGFRKVVAAVGATLGESPENVRLLAKFARDGALAESGAAAVVTLKDVPTRKVFLKLGDAAVLKDAKDLQGRPVIVQQKVPRWHVEDRQQDEGASGEKKN